MEPFYSHGKLLISGEYLVLDGAKSLALPTKFGQYLKVENTGAKVLEWQSYDVDKNCWFHAFLNLEDFSLISYKSSFKNKDKIATTLQEILQTTRSLATNFLTNTDGVKVVTELTFPNEWGLGTSSTLINNIATWANVNAFELLEKSFGGSGYDIACAQNNTAITYQRNGVLPKINLVNFNPDFKNKIFFVYLNKKQDSKEAIKTYKSLTVNKHSLIDEVNDLTQRIIKSKTLFEFELLLSKHETLLSTILQVPMVQQKLFSDYTGVVKSLGAWGGDFVLVTGIKEEVETYFINKGYETIVLFDDMILT